MPQSTVGLLRNAIIRSSSDIPSWVHTDKGLAIGHLAEKGRSNLSRTNLWGVAPTGRGIRKGRKVTPAVAVLLQICKHGVHRWDVGRSSTQMEFHDLIRSLPRRGVGVMNKEGGTLAALA